MSADESSRTVAIVVPLSNRKELTADERISLNHLLHFLGRYDKYLIAPRKLDVAFPGFEVKRFDDKFFGSALAHTKLQLWPRFYETFTDYKYILMYHPDALVFSDQLLEWCQADWDYIGAPWLNCEDSPWIKVSRVGNSGFTLMKIESVLKVIYSRKFTTDPDEYWKDFCASRPRSSQYLNLPLKYLKRLRILNGVRREMALWPYHNHDMGVFDRLTWGRFYVPSGLEPTENSDFFWSDEAVKYYPEFKVAPVEAGLRFAFEVAPRLCFKLNNHQLPFGCHAWTKFDRKFWEPYLLK